MNPVARRYAQALYQEAAAANATDQVDADVQILGETMKGSPELARLFASPVVSREKKEAVLKRLFEGRVGELTTRFIGLLVSKQREALVPAVVQAYNALRDEREGVVEAEVRSAQPLSADEADRIKAGLEARTGQTVRMHIKIQPDLIGGLVVRVGDTVYDRSVRHQLDTLREQLNERAAISLN